MGIMRRWRRRRMLRQSRSAEAELRSRGGVRTLSELRRLLRPLFLLVGAPRVWPDRASGRLEVPVRRPWCWLGLRVRQWVARRVQARLAAQIPFGTDLRVR
jgi:hypothetical protein